MTQTVQGDAGHEASDPTHDVDDIGRHVGRGLRWSVLATFATKIGSFLMSLVLARLLAPEDFGLYAVALAATQFVMHVNDVGIIAAAVQWRGKFAHMVPTASTLAILFSVGWYAIFWVAAPSFASLAGSPEATPLVRLLTAVILIDGITAVRVASLQRHFRHDRLMTAICAGFVVNATLAITLAGNGAGPYSFVVGQVAASVVTGTLVMIFARLPLRYRLERAIARQLVRFGAPLAAGLGIESILLYADSVIVGHALGPVLLGFYLLAFNMASWVPGIATTAVRYVSISGFSRLAELRDEELAAGVRRSVPLLISVILPIAVGIGLLAPELITFLYGERWAPAAMALQFLAVVMVARVFVSLSFDILTSIGATKATVWLNLSWAVTLIPSLAVGTALDGLRGAAIAHAIVSAAVAVPLAVRALHRNGIHLGPALPALGRPLLGGLTMALTVLVLSGLIQQAPFATLSLAGGIGLITYLAVAVPPAQLGQLARRVRRRLTPPVRTG